MHAAQNKSRDGETGTSIRCSKLKCRLSCVHLHASGTQNTELDTCSESSPKSHRLPLAAILPRPGHFSVEPGLVLLGFEDGNSHRGRIFHLLIHMDHQPARPRTVFAVATTCTRRHAHRYQDAIYSVGIHGTLRPRQPRLSLFPFPSRNIVHMTGLSRQSRKCDEPF
jgi:hypothetical protein